MWSVSVVAKFKTRQYVPKTDSPNLMLAKCSRYTVCIYPPAHAKQCSANDRVYLISKGSDIASLSSIPSVMYLSLVLGDEQSSNLTL